MSNCTIITDTEGNQYNYCLPHPRHGEADFPADHPGDYIPFFACIVWGEGYKSQFGDNAPCGEEAPVTTAVVTQPSQPSTLPETGTETVAIGAIGAIALLGGVALNRLARR